MKIEQMIVDADICLKLGKSEKYPFLESLLPKIAEKVYIHQNVYDEILFPAHVRMQVDSLIGSGELVKLSESSLDAKERKIYQATYIKLADLMINKKKPNKNKGEVSSLAMARTKSIPIFATDEKDLQPIIDKVLNTGTDDITCFRMSDIIKKIKNGKLPGLKRKDAKLLWVLSGKSKELFDSSIWPVELMSNK